MIKVKHIAGLLILSALFSAGCRKDPNYPVEPNLDFKSYERYADGSADYTVKFTDGDGDIRPTEEYRDNVLLYYYVKDANGNFILYDYDGNPSTPPEPVKYTTPVIDKSYGKHGIEGEIVIRLGPLHYDSNFPDFRLELEVIDQAGHVSNRVSSPVLHP